MPDPAPLTLEDFRANRDEVRMLPIYGRMDLTRPRRNIDDAFDDFGSTGSGGGSSKSPLDEEQEAEHPFAIKVKITGTGFGSDWSTALVEVVSGTYDTYVGTGGPFNAADAVYPANAYSQTINKADFAPHVYLRVPLQKVDAASGVRASDGNYYRAITGADIQLVKKPTAFEWPNVNSTGFANPITAIKIGTWGIARYNTSPGGIATYKLRVERQQDTSANIVIGDPTNDGDGPSLVAMRTAWAVIQTTETTAEIKQAILLSSVTSDTYVTVTGLTGLTLGTATTYWLSGAFDGTGTPTGWAVTTTPPSGSLMTFDGDGIQTGAWYPLARVVSGSQPQLSGYDFISGGDTYHLEQLCTTRLAVKAVCGGGIGGFYPVPQ